MFTLRSIETHERSSWFFSPPLRASHIWCCECSLIWTYKFVSWWNIEGIAPSKVSGTKNVLSHTKFSKHKGYNYYGGTERRDSRKRVSLIIRRHNLCSLTLLCSTSLALDFDKNISKQTDRACFLDHYWLMVSLDLLDRPVYEELRNEDSKSLKAWKWRLTLRQQWCKVACVPVKMHTDYHNVSWKYTSANLSLFHTGINLTY